MRSLLFAGEGVLISMRKPTLPLLVLSAILSVLVQRLAHCSATPPGKLLAEEAGQRESCRLHRVLHTISIKNCKPKRMLSWACQGACLSYAQAAAEKEAHMERYCTCCQETGVARRNISLLCRGLKGRASFRKVITRIMLPTSCLCRPCSAGVGIEPLEFAGIGDKRNLWTIM
ncbi:hypothetical protein LSH36_161g00045 [Paralvinella palmiformis]|uniref:Bursicon n=1 Tax=Paralvinella palmiformis TaxID=53620 RepID=A0AAD9JUK2_9ANNE|nr:hypothetical protein LSH36_161g00045 [Paralvinella palmiformis]